MKATQAGEVRKRPRTDRVRDRRQEIAQLAAHKEASKYLDMTALPFGFGLLRVGLMFLGWAWAKGTRRGTFPFLLDPSSSSLLTPPPHTTPLPTTHPPPLSLSTLRAGTCTWRGPLDPADREAQSGPLASGERRRQGRQPLPDARREGLVCLTAVAMPPPAPAPRVDAASLPWRVSMRAGCVACWPSSSPLLSPLLRPAWACLEALLPPRLTNPHPTHHKKTMRQATATRA